MEEKIPSSSSLHRYVQKIPVHIIKKLNTVLIKSVKEKFEDLNIEEQDMSNFYIDTTAIEANIHFPVDWLLLRDITKSLVQSIILIRENGLKHRIPDPMTFVKEINDLCIKMSHVIKQKNPRKQRKKIIKEMFEVVDKIKLHGYNYRNLLLENWRQKTNFTKKQVAQIFKKIDNALEQILEAVKQCYERIINENKIPNDKKILSIFDKNVNVIFRGKYNNDVEFGNKLFLAEIKSGLIIDWKLYKYGSPSDSIMIPGLFERIISQYGEDFIPETVTSDRGFVSEKAKEFLMKLNIKNNMCPRGVNELKEALKDPIFRDNLKRRCQLEGRIGILKNIFMENTNRCKSFEARDKTLAWSILAHNLWVVSRFKTVKSENELKAA